MTLDWHGDQVLVGLEGALEHAMLLGAEHVLEESNRIIPHETGDLERAGEAQAEGRRSRVSYESIYAIPQHENLEYRHDPGRQAKYLETAGIQAGPELEAIVGEAVRRLLE